jgi:hypothetical protein
MLTRFSLLALLLSSLVAVSSDAIVFLPNLAPNPDFDAGIDGWSGGGSQVTWASDFDVAGEPNSGSLKIQVDGEVGAVRGVQACIPIVGGELYVFGGRYFIPSGQIPSGQASVIVQWYDDPHCVGYMASAAVPSNQDHGVIDAWTNLVSTDTPPVNADSALLTLGGWKLVGQENQPDFVVYFDEVSLLPEPTDSLAASAAFATLWVMRRALGGRRATP